MTTKEYRVKYNFEAPLRVIITNKAFTFPIIIGCATSASDY